VGVDLDDLVGQKLSAGAIDRPRDHPVAGSTAP